MPIPFSPAGMSLGLNTLGRVPGLGDALAGQVGDETDELRKRQDAGGGTACPSGSGRRLAGVGLAVWFTVRWDRRPQRNRTDVMVSKSGNSSHDLTVVRLRRRGSRRWPALARNRWPTP